MTRRVAAVRGDATDEQILLALASNARISVVDLARRIGLSRSATQERLQRLERDGVIAGYTIRRGSDRSSARVRAFFAVRHGPKGTCARTMHSLSTVPEVRSAYSLAGEIDVLLEIETASADDLERVRCLVEGVQGVEAVRTHVVLTTHFAHRFQDAAESP